MRAGNHGVNLCSKLEYESIKVRYIQYKIYFLCMYSILKIQSSNPTSKLWLRIIYRIFNALQNVNLIICHKRVPRITKWHTHSHLHTHTLHHTLTRTKWLTEAMHRDRNVYAMRRHLAICVNSISFYSLTNIFRQLSVCVRRHFVLPLSP